MVISNIKMGENQREIMKAVSSRKKRHPKYVIFKVIKIYIKDVNLVQIFHLNEDKSLSFIATNWKYYNKP